MFGRNRINVLFVFSVFAGLVFLSSPSKANLTNLSSTTFSVCPFCSAVGQTVSEKIATADVVVMATLEVLPEQSLLANQEELPKGIFRVRQVIAGDKYIEKEDEFETIIVGQYDVGATFMVIGVDAPNVAWSTPMEMTERAQAYVNKVVQLPDSGPKRLLFFQDYLQDEESMLAFDAMDEFAQAPYEDLIAMKDKMHHDKLIGWIKDDEVPVNRKRLYYVMLGLCGTEKDLPLFEEILRSDDRDRQRGLDSLVACYLNLKGADGLKLINEVFLDNPDKDYVDVFAVISALRFHGAETDVIPRKELLPSMRLVLNRPKMADMVIPDLARWEDWSVVDKLVEMFKKPPEESSDFIRVPIVSYLLACPNDNAKKAIEELRKVDSNSVLRAEKMMQWEMGWDEDDDDDDGEMILDDEDSDKDNSSDEDKKADKKKDDKKKGAANDQDKLEVASFSYENDNVILTSLSPEVSSLSNLLEQQDAQDSSSESVPNINASDVPSEAGMDENQELEIKDSEILKNSAEMTPSKDIVSATVIVPGPSNSETFVSAPASDSGASGVQPNSQSPNIPENPPVANSGTDTNPTNDDSVDQPVASSTLTGGLAVILVPMTFCIFLFLLSWSVINGWFERLIY